MEKIYAPWRSNYVSCDTQGKSSKTLPDECVFCCNFAADEDRKHFILYRGKRAGVIMNLYPYNAGHLMIIPYEHKSALKELDRQTRTEIMELASAGTNILFDVLAADGSNIGLNLGRAGGAGIPSHLHMHIVPRWTGDTNFMPVIAETKPVSFDLNKMFELLKPSFEKL